MPSSSLLLRSSATLLSLFSSPTFATYTNVKTYSGTTFFDDWNFYDQPDLNNGFVTYLGKQSAINAGLLRTSTDHAYMSVDSTHTYNANSGPGRPSVRIESQETWAKGLFISDINHMPGGVCGVWPAWWTLGSGPWPFHGEIDIIESINNRVLSLAALHVGEQSSINNDPRSMTGSIVGTNCFYDPVTHAGAAGCAIINNNPQSYGPGLNAANGGVTAMEWTDDYVKVWFWAHGSVPQDVQHGTPDPSTWGLPAQAFAGPDVGLDAYKEHRMIFNTNFCGDFGNAVWASEGCATQTGYNTCAAYVASNPSAFANQYWDIGSVKVYQKNVAATTTTTTTTKTSTTSTSTRPASTTTTTTHPTTLSTTTIKINSVSVATTSSTTSAATHSTTTSAGFTKPTLTISPAITSRGSTNGTTALTSGRPTSISATHTAWTNWNGTLTTYTNSTNPASGFSSSTLTDPWNPKPSVTTTTYPVATTPVVWGAWQSSSDSTVTVTKTWVEPCETGYTTKTTVVVTTGVSTIPMTVVTTTCPGSWGFTTPVVITVPVTAASATATIAAGAGGSHWSADGSAAATSSKAVGGTNGYGYGNGNGDTVVNAHPSSTFVVTVSPISTSTVKPTTTAAAIASSSENIHWNQWSSSTAASHTTTGPVAKYTGTGERTIANVGLFVITGLAAILML